MYSVAMYVGMYVCMYVTLKNANFGTLCTRISVSCMLHIRGVRKGCRRTIVVNVTSNIRNGKKTMRTPWMARFRLKMKTAIKKVSIASFASPQLTSRLNSH